MYSGRLRLLTLAALLVLTLAATLSCGGEEKGAPATVSLLLSPSPNSNHAGVYVAQQKGYFSEENLTVNVEISADREAAMRSVGAGTKDFVIGNMLRMLQLRDEDVPVMGIAAISQHALHGIIAPESAGIEKPLDLEGMRVGYTGIVFSEKFLNTMLVNDGLNGVEDVNLVIYETGLTEALLDGQVDAILSDDWPRSQAIAENRGESVTILKFEGWSLPEHYEHLLVTNDTNFKDREDMVRRFTRAVRRGYEDALADPQSAIDALQAGTTETVDETLERARIDILAPLWEPFRPVRGSRDPLVGEQDAQIYQTLIRWMRKNQLVGSVVHYQSAFHNKFSLAEE
jgi:putative hydroxymethylpyrimidine transport system substrate-binding protein